MSDEKKPEGEGAAQGGEDQAKTIQTETEQQPGAAQPAALTEQEAEPKAGEGDKTE